jgi:hypothetical protein
MAHGSTAHRDEIVEFFSLKISIIGSFSLLVTYALAPLSFPLILSTWSALALHFQGVHDTLSVLTSLALTTYTTHLQPAVLTALSILAHALIVPTLTTQTRALTTPVTVSLNYKELLWTLLGTSLLHFLPLAWNIDSAPEQLRFLPVIGKFVTTTAPSFPLPVLLTALLLYSDWSDPPLTTHFPSSPSPSPSPASPQTSNSHSHNPGGPNQSNSKNTPTNTPPNTYQAAPRWSALQQTTPLIPKPAPHLTIPSFRVGLWNVCGLSEHKWTALPHILEDQQVDACVIVETKWSYTTSKAFVHQSDWKLLATDYSPMQPSSKDPRTSQRGGVALILPPDSLITINTIKQWQHTRTTAATWQLQHPDWLQPIYITGIYKSPGKNLTDTLISEDTQILSHILTSIPPDKTHLVMGDLNARTGADLEGPHSVQLPPRVGDGHQVTPVGLALMGVLQHLKWLIVTNRFRHGTTTFTRSIVINDPHPTDQKSCIDYFLINETQSQLIQGEAILAHSGTELGRTDHNLCLLDILIPHAPPNNDTPNISLLPLPPRKFFNTTQLSTNEYPPSTSLTTKRSTPPQTTFQTALNLRLPSWTKKFKTMSREGMDNSTFQIRIDKAYEELTEILDSALELSIGSKTSSVHTKSKNRRRLPPPPSLLPLLITRNTRLKDLNTSQTKENQNPSQYNSNDRRQKELQYLQACRAVNKHALTQKRRTLLAKVNEKDILATQAGDAWRTLKSLVQNQKKGVPNLVKDTQGVLITSTLQSAYRWHEAREYTSRDRSAEQGFNTRHLRDLTQKDNLLESLATSHPHPSPLNSLPPSFEEISRALETCSNGTATGTDCIPFEAYKYGGPVALEALHTLLTTTWESGLHPTKWNEANIIPLFKGGPDITDVDKYRAITLLQATSKIYEAVLQERINTTLNTQSLLSPSQGGFRASVGPQETVYGLLSVLLHRKQKKQQTYVAFVDFETAFPTLFKPVVWTSLHDMGVQGKLWKNTRHLYADVKSHVLHPYLPDDAYFAIPQGLREGSKLSPLLFNIAVNDMQAYFESHQLGVQMQTSECQTFAGIWQYADDVALVANSPEELQLMLNHLRTYCADHALIININKTKIVEYNTSLPPATYTVRDLHNIRQPIMTLENFPYLGVHLDKHLNMEAAHAATRGAFWGAHHYAEKLGMHTWGIAVPARVAVWQTYVASQLTHKLPFLKPAQVAGLQADVNRSLRLTFSPSASPTALQRELNLTPLALLYAKSTANLFGRLQAAQTSFNFGIVHSILMAEPTHTHRLSKTQQKALHTLHLSTHFPFVQICTLPQPLRPADIDLIQNPRPNQPPLTPYSRSWELTVDNHTTTASKEFFHSWLNTKSHHGSEYKKVLTAQEFHSSGQGPPHWLHLPLPPSTKQTLLHIRSLSAYLLRHTTHTPTQRPQPTFHEAFCIQCYTNHQQGPVPQHHDNITHALFTCPHTTHSRLSLHNTASSFLNTHKLSHRISGNNWLRQPWSTLSNHHKLQMLLGGKLSASNWHHNSRDLENIQQWHIKFLDTMVPKVQKILLGKGTQTRLLQAA